VGDSCEEIEDIEEDHPLKVKGTFTLGPEVEGSRGGRRFGRRLSRLIRLVNRLLSECSR